jgi:SAM-dependent methyltransferase
VRKVDAAQQPSRWLVEHLDLLPPGGHVLDVACGRGRHTFLLAEAGFRVHAIDRDAAAIEFVRESARQRTLPVTGAVVDLETEPPPDLGRAVFDAIVVFRYLHRPLFPALVEALAPGGRLVYETFTAAQALRGRPTDPRFLLAPGELRVLVAPLVILEAREGEVDGAAVAAIVAERR